jgi:TIR domain
MEWRQYLHTPSLWDQQGVVLDASARPTSSRQIDTPLPPKRGFLGYCRADRASAHRLQTQLATCQHTCPLDLWDEARLPAGCLWQEELTHALTSASFAVLLVSPDFLAASYLTANLLPPLLRQAREHGTRIVSVITRPCLFEESPLSDFHPFNDPNRPLSALSTNARDQIWVDLIRFLLHSTPPSALQ